MRSWFILFSTFLITLLTSVVSFPQRICFLSVCYNRRSTSRSTLRRQRSHTGSSSSTTAIRMEALESIGKILSDTFRFPPINQNSSTSEDVKLKRSDLKQDLLQVCRQLPTSSSVTSSTIRFKVEEIMKQLSPLSPVMNTANSPLLQKEWLLVWTTEKEINVFQDLKLSKCITQTITNDSKGGGRLENLIEFVNGGFLSVEGVLSVDETNNSDDGGIGTKAISQRTNFQFTSAKLNLGWGGRTFTIPPIGKGWFDTIYLDDDLRVDMNSRDDILICTPSSKKQ